MVISRCGIHRPICAYTCTTYTYPNTYTNTHTCTTYTYSNTYTNTHTYSDTHTYSHAYPNTYSDTSSTSCA
jgi:hypothetical protein